MPATVVNLNGVNELDLNLAGTVTATTAAGVTTITQSGVVNSYGDSSTTCAGGESVITLGSTPISGSIKVILNGVTLNSAMYTVVGSVITLVGLTFGVGDVVRTTWSTAAVTPGAAVVTTSGSVLHTFAAYADNGTGNLLVVTFPGAATAGELAVVCIASAHGSLPATPTGWALVDSSSGTGSFWGGGVYSKTLTAGDISTGSVSFGITDPWNACIATFTGAVTITDHITSRGVATPVTLTTALSATAGYTAMYFGSQGAVSGGSTGAATWNRGTSRGTANNGVSDSCSLYTEALVATGTVTGIVTYASPTASHNFQAIVVVSTASVAPGTIPEVNPSQIVGLPAGIANVPTSLTTVGSSGPATLSGNVLNVPNYASGASGVSSLNTLTGALTIAAGANVTVTPSGGNTLTIASTGGGSSAFALLATQTVSGTSTTQITFGSISNAYRNLKVVVIGRTLDTSSAIGNVGLIFNGDTTASHYPASIYFFGLTDGTEPSAAGYGGFAGGAFPTSGSSNITNGTAEVDVFGYSTSSANFPWKCTNAGISTGRTQCFTLSSYAPASSTTITSVTVTAINGSLAVVSFAAGTVAYLYGW